ncbi:MAG TPA: acylphosphatase [Chitinophagaceae bacterium]|jgi:acylphosphatase|nr:acylphosphatase [Chitinophagaceae bacterium]
MLQTISINVKGKVQGVYYRQTTQEKATALGIKGTVRNQPDRSVKIMATGTKLQLDKLTAWCRQGPSRAEVSDIICYEEELRSFPDFRIV